MKELLQRYTFPYLLGCLLFATIWLVSILTMDGWCTVVAGVLLFMYLILMLPVMIYMDYQQAVKLIAVEMKTRTRRTDIESGVDHMASFSGIPKFICDFVAKEKLSKPTTSLEQHGKQ